MTRFGSQAELASTEFDDMWAGPGAKRYAAYIYANVGEVDLAIDLLEELSETVYINVGWTGELRLSPYWDPLREDPRFQALLEKHEKRTD